MRGRALLFSAMLVVSAVAVAPAPGVGAPDDGAADATSDSPAVDGQPGPPVRRADDANATATPTRSATPADADDPGDETGGGDRTADADPDAGTGNDSVGAASEATVRPAVAAARTHTRAYESGRLSEPRLLSGPSDVPGDAPVAASVARPHLLSTGPGAGDGRVRLYTYHAEHGLVLNWTVEVRNGSVARRVARVAAKGVARGPIVEGFNPPVGGVVVRDDFAALSSHTANISFSRNYVRVDDAEGSVESFDPSPVTVSLSNFGPGDEQVDLNITVEGTNRVIPSESGSQPTLQTDGDGNGSVQWTPADDVYSGRVCVEATSPSTTEQWCHDDPDPTDDNFSQDDASGMLTVEEANTDHYIVRDSEIGLDASLKYRYVYTDQNLDRGNANGILEAVKNGTHEAFVDQMVWGFNDHVGLIDGNDKVNVFINDNTYRFHGDTGTYACCHVKIHYGTNERGRTGGAALHAETLMAHEHMHIVQFSYGRAAARNGNPAHWGDDWDWYIEGLASFMQTQTAPNVTHERSAVWGDVSGDSAADDYVEDPDRPLRNHSYDYTVFWMHVYNRTKDHGTVSHPSDRYDALEQFMEELQTEGTSNASRDGPEAISRALRNTSGYASYREVLREFHVDTFRATVADQERVWYDVHANSTFPYNETVLDWGEHLDGLATVREERDPLIPNAYVGRVDRWGVDYAEVDGFDPARAAWTNRSDVSVRLVLATENDTVVRGPVGTDTVRGYVGENSTAIDPDNQTVGLVVSPLGGVQNTSYNVTTDEPLAFRPVTTDPGERAVYVVGINAPHPNRTGTTPYLGDLYVGAHPKAQRRNLSVDLSLADGTAPPSPVRTLDTPAGPDGPAAIERVASVDPSARSVWRLTVKQGLPRTSSRLRDIPELYSNYYTERDYDAVGVYGMPTTLSVLDVPDRQAGDRTAPGTVSFVVEVENGGTPYRYSPFPSPTADHFRITVGGQVVPPSDIAVTEQREHRYRLTFTPPTVPAAGDSRVCLAFEDTKFGVTEVSDSNCGEPVVYAPGDPWDGSSIAIDTPITTVGGDGGPHVVDLVNLHLGTAMADDDVSVVSVDEEGSETVVATQDAGDAENRAEMAAAVEAAFGDVDPPDGETAVAAGLERSLAAMRESEAPTRATLLVSDGRVRDEDALAAIVEEYREAGVEIHAVAAGEEANRDRLRRIARRTGGTVRVAESGPELRRAMDAFDREFGDDPGAHLATGQTGPGGTFERTVPVDAGADEAVLRVDLGPRAGRDATVRLFRPDGSSVERDDSVDGTADESVAHARRGGTVVYRLTDPEAGPWRYGVVNAGDGLRVRARTAVESRTALSAGTTNTSAERGAEESLGAALVGPEGPLDAGVTATVTGPDGDPREVSLEATGGGSYSAPLPTGETGEYVADVHATRRRGETARLERVERLRWTVVPPGPTATVRAGTASVGVGETARVPVVLEAAPSGLQTYAVEVCLRGDLARPAGVESGDVGVPQRLDAPANCVAFRGADVARQVGPGDAPATLGTVVYERTAPGSAPVDVTVRELTDDNGTTVATRTGSGEVRAAADATTAVEVVLDGAPHGLSAYNLTVEGDPAVVDVRPDAVTGEGFSVVAGGSGARTVTLRGVDYEDSVGETDRTLTLATVAYAGEVDPANLSLTAHELLDDFAHSHRPGENDTDTGADGGSGDYTGDPIDPSRLSLRLADGAGSPFEAPVAGGVGVPTDPDGDDLYEDVDGDEDADFDDAIALAFVDGSSFTDAQVDALDFDSDGDVDFGDAITLAFQV